MDQTTQRLMQGASGGGAPKHIDDYFVQHSWEGYGSTEYLYVPQASKNDFTTVGGMVIIKGYDSTQYGEGSWGIWDTVRGDNKRLQMHQSNNQDTYNVQIGNQTISVPNNQGHVNFADGTSHSDTGSGEYFGMIFRQEDHFFKLGNYSGNGGTQTITHGMKSIPSMIWIKSYTGSVGGSWMAWHREYSTHKGSDYVWALEGQSAPYSSTRINNVTATQFSVNSSNFVNNSSTSYVWYAFGGEEEIWGLKGDEKAIISGVVNQSVTHSGGTIRAVGWRPQFCIGKKTNAINASHGSDLNRGHNCVYTSAGPMNLSGPGVEQRAGLAFNVNRMSDYASKFQESKGFISQTSEGLWAGEVLTRAQDGNCDVLYWAIRSPYSDNHADNKDRILRNIYYTGSNTGRRVFGGMTPTSTMVHQQVDWMMIFNRSGNAGGGKARLLSRAKYVAQLSDGLFGGGSMYWQGGAGMNISTNLGGPIAYGGKSGYNRYYDYEKFDMSYMQNTPGICMPFVWGGDGTGNGRVIPHDLQVKPELIAYWNTEHQGGPNGGMLHHIAMGNSETPGLNWWQHTMSMSSDNHQQSQTPTTGRIYSEPTKNNITIGSTLNSSGKGYYGIVMASKTGIVKIGNYIGDGQAEQDIDCGFSNGIRFLII